MIKRNFPAANSSPFLMECKKKLVKSPKACLTDSGILHYLVVVTDFNNLSGNPVIGNSWKSFVFNQIISIKRAQTFSGSTAHIMALKLTWFLPGE